MIGAPLPPHEYVRLLDLARYEILDTPREEVFDRITRLTARLLGTPVAVINFVDQDRQWGKSSVGVGDTTAPRHDSFCAWTILQDGPLVIEDTQTDPRFAHNPMVTGEPHIRMYAGAPLTTPAGQRIGTLCVTHHQFHPLTPDDLQALQDLAALVMGELELRASSLALAHELNAQQLRNADLQRSLAHAHVLEGVSSLMDLDLSPEETTLSAAALLGEALNADYIGLLIFEGGELRVEAAHQTPQVAPAMGALPAPRPDWSGSITRTLTDLRRPLYLDDYPSVPGALTTMVDAGVQQVAWKPLGTRGGVTSLLMAVRLRDNPVTRWRGSDRALLEAAGRSVRGALDRRLEMQLARQEARHDALTGLLNRRALEEDLRQRQQDGAPFLLAGLDLDGLKALNDQEGHAQGDKLLQVFARTLRMEVGKAGEVYRLGGDEFVILESVDEDAVHHAVDMAVLAARQVGALRGASVGVAHSHEGEGEALLALADERMYGVKRRRQAVRQQQALSS
ncbi:diguanylate cyclase domain-containing protein [Deinococcus radiopugnans]|uniref:Diguanylate cyclase (GGDEF)-like protein n=1 Tax=Deinococcus radiopugnans ATCC 19172 TaxID=585398 RepID=A0A5C4YBE6_9DEIO|nr:sensor domain-containing diguanylate cyclase [Deinococcus radiopugnans]MBB6015375.1 diguanylate cyclase (GGDEF)-like protein [Deinococcus radiopugnans ATCC 19172]TNM72936.1 sensor domain-containing diguanylate cyclase [Deinococcus radiopugnans ATCC 19172]